MAYQGVGLLHETAEFILRSGLWRGIGVRPVGAPKPGVALASAPTESQARSVPEAKTPPESHSWPGPHVAGRVVSGTGAHGPSGTGPFTQWSCLVSSWHDDHLLFLCIYAVNLKRLVFPQSLHSGQRPRNSMLWSKILKLCFLARASSVFLTSSSSSSTKSV